MRAGQHVRHNDIIVPIPIEIAERLSKATAALGRQAARFMDDSKTDATRLSTHEGQ